MNTEGSTPFENEMRWAMKKYKKLHPDTPLPHITPHVYRHTFCTNMANAGKDIKTLQYIMGHSDVGVTLNVYTHASYDRAAEQMAKIVDFKDVSQEEKRINQVDYYISYYTNYYTICPLVYKDLCGFT